MAQRNEGRPGARAIAADPVPASGQAVDRPPPRTTTRGLYGSSIGENMAKAAFAELIGTMLLVLTGTAVACAAVLGRATAGPAYDSLAVALGFGLVLVALVAALGHASGCHLNPAVTLGLAVTGKFPWRYVPAYLAAQVGGAVLGSLLVWAAFGAPARSVARLAAPGPAPGVGVAQAFLVEALITFLLVFVIVSVATDERAESATTAVAVGFALAAAVLIGGPVTGGAVNPARALGPQIVAAHAPMFFVYLLAPVVGGILAAVVYDRLISTATAPEEE